MEAVVGASVLIALARGDKQVIKALERFRGWRFYITVITNFELKVGALGERERALLEAMPKLPFDERASNIAAGLFKALRRRGSIPSWLITCL